jgi:hypothetical protein
MAKRRGIAYVRQALPQILRRRGALRGRGPGARGAERPSRRPDQRAEEQKPESPDASR